MNYILFVNTFRGKYAGIIDPALLLNYLREELQYLILGVICTKVKYPLYFLGGTQLRLSYKINRFSEDIDFALEKPDENFPSSSLLQVIAAAFSEKITGFKLHAKMNTRRNVVKIMLSFSELLYDLKLSPLRDETVKIKIEIDVNPPAHAVYVQKQYRSLIQDYSIFAHDLSTGFAGKLGAVLEREYQKGRDYYDLKWYLQQTPPIPINLEYFNANSVQQKQPTYKKTFQLLKAVIEKIRGLDVRLMRRDLQRFVAMDPNSFEAWSNSYREETIALLQNYLKTL